MHPRCEDVDCCGGTIGAEGEGGKAVDRVEEVGDPAAVRGEGYVRDLQVREQRRDRLHLYGDSFGDGHRR